ncbi:Ig-like domain-containing protein [Leucobacter sp. gxy201]|uniref:Ig-like domain-containing protein n=1 Tax=Leucobacter sp. gxy201 TaxID=2957200 RepID=UPI003D9FD676
MTKRRPLALGAAAALGLGSLVIAAPAMAEDAEPQSVENTAQVAEVASAAAISTEERIAKAAALNGVDESIIAQQVQTGELLVSPSGSIAELDQWGPAEAAQTEIDALSAPIPGTPAGGSLPGAPFTVYLDFDGFEVVGTEWNELPGSQPSYSLGASAIDQQRVWASIAEDYAPFNVNVTTADPGTEALVKSSADDANYGTHLVITDTPVPDFAAGSAGIAFRGSAGSSWAAPAFVFVGATNNDADGNENPATAIPEVVGMAGSHEVGHTLGLQHDGFGSEEYYNPDGGIWGPVMGAPYHAPLVQWSNGDYNSATNTEDDFSVMTDRTPGNPDGTGGGAVDVLLGWTYPDGTWFEGTSVTYCDTNSADIGNPQPGDYIVLANDAGTCDPVGPTITAQFDFRDRATFAADDHGNDAASATALDNSNDTFEATGIIGQTGENDVFSFTTAGGDVLAEVAIAEISPNLDAKLTLTDSNGTEITSDAPETVLNGNTLDGLDASIQGNLTAGTYYLTVTGVGQGDPASASLAAANGYSNYGSLGNYTISGTAPASDETPVVDAPAITSPVTGATVPGDVTFSGLGATGAELTIVVTAADGTEYTATTTVSNGQWSVQLPAELAAGDYTVVATQVLDGTESAPSDAVTFTVEAEDAADAADAGATTGADGTTAANGADGGSAAGTGADGTTAASGADGTSAAAGAAAAANGTAATGATASADPGTGGGGLAHTGGDYGFGTMLSLITVALLVSGGVVALVAIRQRKQQEEMAA